MAEQILVVKIKLLDKEYQVNCLPSEQEALIESAVYLNDSMRKIRERGTMHGAEKIAVMAALNIAHDMLREKRKSKETRAKTAQQLGLIQDKIDLALAGSI